MFLCSGREEEESLRDKIRADHERALQEAKEKLRKSREELQAEIQTEKNKVAEDLKKKEAGPKPLPPVPMPKVVGVGDGEPPEPDVKEKRDKIREVRWRGPLSWKWSSSWVGFAGLQRLSTQSCKGLTPGSSPPLTLAVCLVSHPPRFHRPGQVRLSLALICCYGDTPERSSHVLSWYCISCNHFQMKSRAVSGTVGQLQA